MSRADFERIQINRSEIDQNLLDISNRERTSYFPWNGQFSPQFIEIMLSHYAKPGDLILDPFAGSGTVLYEAARLGLDVVGVELNPSAYFMSRAALICRLPIDKRREILNSIKNVIDNSNDGDVVDRLATTFVAGSTECDTAFLLVVLMDLFNKPATKENALNKLKKIEKNYLSFPYTRTVISCFNGDVRTSLPNGLEVDVVLTSPPYINVFNYHQNYRRSVERLGYDVLKIAKDEFGSNRRNRGNRILTVIEYCQDIALSIGRLSVSCKEGCRIIFVVGRESSVLGYSFSNSAIIYDIFTKIFGMAFIVRQERCFKNRFGKLIYEDILHFSNTATNLSDAEIIRRASDIAKDHISEHLCEDGTNKEKLEQAIESIAGGM